jgi:hypothetical protein
VLKGKPRSLLATRKVVDEIMRKKVKQFIDEMFQPIPPAKVKDISTHERRKLTPELLDQVLNDVEAGNVLTVKEMAAKLRCSPNKARDVAKKEPGSFRIGSDYRVPHCVFRNIVAKLAAA